MTSLLIRWVLSAVALVVVAYVVPGVYVSGFGSALLAAAAIGFVNATLGTVIKLITLPARILTLGILSLIINAILLLIAAALVPGFRVSGFFAAFFGSILLSAVNALFGLMIPEKKE